MRGTFVTFLLFSAATTTPLRAQSERGVSLAAIITWMHGVKATATLPPEQYEAWFDEVVADCRCTPKVKFIGEGRGVADDQIRGISVTRVA